MKMIVFIFTLLAGNFVQAQRWEGVWGFDGEKPGGAGVSASRILLRTYKGIYIYPELAEAFIEFAKSPAGYALLAKFGEERQVISKAHEKEIPPFKEDGFYQIRKMDITLNWANPDFDSDEPLPGGDKGGTSYEVSNGRMIHRVKINKMLNNNNPFADAFLNNSKSPTNKTNLEMSRIGTIFHEVGIHVFINAKDYDDDKIMNVSPITKKYYDGDSQIKWDSPQGPQKIHHKHTKEAYSDWVKTYISVVVEIWKNKNPNIEKSIIKKPLNRFCRMKRYLLFFLISFISGCTNENQADNPEKELLEILDILLPYEKKNIEEYFLTSELKSGIYSNSNIAYLIPGVSYEESIWKEELDYALRNLDGGFYELKLNKRTYNHLVESVCGKLDLGFQIPKDASEFDLQMRQGNVFAVIEMHNIWICEKGDRFFYYSRGSHRRNKFMETSYSIISVFKKEKNKWVFEKFFQR